MHRKKKTNGALAQLVEQRTENPCVPGSIPGGTTPPFISPVFGSFQVRVSFLPYTLQVIEGKKKAEVFLQIKYK